MPEQTRRQFASGAIDAYQSALSQDANAKDARRLAVSSSTDRVSQSSRNEAQQLADRAIKSYASNLIDKSPGDAKAAAVQEVTQPQEVGLNVKQYSRNVMDSYNRNQGQGETVVLAHASAAANEGKAELRDAVRTADKTLKRYSELRQTGQDHIAAREQTAKEMGNRFDERGKDTHRHERQRSNGLGL